jgi:hypothetical protein
MALCSQSDLEALRQIDVTAEPDPTITALIVHAEGILEGLTRRRFDPVTGFEVAMEEAKFVDGRVYLEHFPIDPASVVVSVDAVPMDPARYWANYNGQVMFGGAGTGVYTWDWQYHLPRGGGPSFLPNTVIAYDGGIDDPAEAPQDLRTLCSQILVNLFDRGALTAAAGPGVRSVSLGGFQESYGLTEEDLTSTQMAVVRRYRHKIPVHSI